MGLSKRREPTPQLRPLPRCKAILACETIVVDETSHRPSLIGVVDAFEIASFPGRSLPFRVFVQLAEGIGKYDVSVEFHDRLNDEIALKTSPVTVEFFDRLDRVYLNVEIAALTLPEPNTYDIVLLADGEEVERQRVSFVSVEGSDHE